jgi:hypothetical protein
MPQLCSVAGMGLRCSQPPFAYSKKSSPGLTEVSRSATRKSATAVGCAGSAPPAHCAAHTSINRMPGHCRDILGHLLLFLAVRNITELLPAALASLRDGFGCNREDRITRSTGLANHAP